MSRSRLQSLNSNIDHMKCSLLSKNSPRNTVDFEAACSVYIRFRGVNGYLQSLWKEWISRVFPEVKTISLAPCLQDTISESSADALMTEWVAKMGKAKVRLYPPDSPFAAWADDMAARYPDAVKITSNKKKYVPEDSLVLLGVALPRSPDDAIGLSKLNRSTQQGKCIKRRHCTPILRLGTSSCCRTRRK